MIYLFVYGSCHVNFLAPSLPSGVQYRLDFRIPASQMSVQSYLSSSLLFISSNHLIEIFSNRHAARIYLRIYSLGLGGGGMKRSKSNIKWLLVWTLDYGVGPNKLPQGKGKRWRSIHRSLPFRQAERKDLIPSHVHAACKMPMYVYMSERVSETNENAAGALALIKVTRTCTIVIIVIN